MTTITFTLGEIDAREARSLVSMLHSIFGDAVLLDRAKLTVGAVSVSGPADRILPFRPADDLAADGHPVGHIGEDHRHVGPVSGETTEPAASAAERDVNGIPWDARIHTSTKSTNKDGTWTRRRNLEDAIFDAVMSELKAANTVRTIEALQPAPTVPNPPSVEAPAAQVFAPSPTVAAPAAPSNGVPVPPPTTAAQPVSPVAPAPSGDVPTFVQLMTTVTQAQAAGKLNPDDVREMLGQVGFSTIAQLATADDGMRAAFGALLTAKTGA